MKLNVQAASARLPGLVEKFCMGRSIQTEAELCFANLALSESQRQAFMIEGKTPSATPCFTPGTLVVTPQGERLVEDLIVGDEISTRDNGAQEIRWIAKNQMSGRVLASMAHLRPVLIRQGSLGNNLPVRDMQVSPNHRVLVASSLTALYFEEREVLAAAKHLINNRGIHALTTTSTTYIHFMFDRHELVLSNGSWTESFQPSDSSLRGLGNAQRNEILEIFPQVATSRGIDGYMAARRILSRREARRLLD